MAVGTAAAARVVADLVAGAWVGAATAEVGSVEGMAAEERAEVGLVEDTVEATAEVVLVAVERAVVDWVAVATAEAG